MLTTSALDCSDKLRIASQAAAFIKGMLKDVEASATFTDQGAVVSIRLVDGHHNFIVRTTISYTASLGQIHRECRELCLHLFTSYTAVKAVEALYS